MAPNLGEYIPIGSEAAKAALKLAKDNPTSFAVVTVGTGGLVLVAAPGVAVATIVAALNTIGFGTGGIIGGTFAASAQAAIGNVAAHSLFATLTSAGAGGYGVSVLSAGVQAVGGTATALAAAGAWMMSCSSVNGTAGCDVPSELEACQRSPPFEGKESNIEVSDLEQLVPCLLDVNSTERLLTYEPVG